MRNDGNFEGLTLNYNDLPDTTRYRFAELEIGRAVRNLAPFIPIPNQTIVSAQYILKTICPDHTLEDEDNWLEVFSSFHMTKGTKEELATYFRYKNISYTNIRKLTGLSPNTIARYRFVNPYYYTKYPKWDNYLLFRWDSLKQHLNIWNQELFQNKF